MIADPNIAFLLVSRGSLAIFIEIINFGAIFPGVFGVIALLLGFFALSNEGRRADVVQHVDDRSFRVQDAEVDNGIDLHGDVVLRDHVLTRHIHRHYTQVDSLHLLDERQYEEQSGSTSANKSS